MSKNKGSDKIEVLDNQVNEKIKSIKKFKRNSYWFFPIWFISSRNLNSNRLVNMKV